jgi:hypothetical protein
MKKTDLFCMDINDDHYKSYKQMNRLGKTTLIDDTINRYGSVCKFAMGLGWFLGQNDDTMINKMKVLSENKTVEKLERFSLNFVINHGIKEAYAELIELKASLIENSVKLGVDTKTSKEIIDIVVKDIDNIVKDVSVDMLTQYDDVSTL